MLTDEENLSNSAPDDGLGYLNTATTTNVIGKYYEYSGEDHDGDGKGDEKTEVTVTKKDYPDELGDKKDDANTPVQKRIRNTLPTAWIREEWKMHLPRAIPENSDLSLARP